MKTLIKNNFGLIIFYLTVIGMAILFETPVDPVVAQPSYEYDVVAINVTEK